GQVTLEKIVALDPKTDRWADRSGLAGRDGGRGEFLFAADTPVAHELYLRQGRIFRGAPLARGRGAGGDSGGRARGGGGGGGVPVRARPARRPRALSPAGPDLRRAADDAAADPADDSR